MFRAVEEVASTLIWASAISLHLSLVHTRLLSQLTAHVQDHQHGIDADWWWYVEVHLLKGLLQTVVVTLGTLCS
jgi:hypothetical protein